ncbi:MAG: zinc ribbon domain-containing protein [Clostridium sp.]|nr:zinc ribbon domain-containing protein [Prevotella sp.]MCM1429671.1 zinc ribbon domain-containing protein [Clostridium sp.]MCM1476174.1 zinc ribbon domain-containing protein [Muribaculaceae bacterium]
MICPTCNNNCPDGDRFCRKCGSQLPAAPAPSSAPTPPVIPVIPQPDEASVYSEANPTAELFVENPPRKRKITPWIIIVIIAAVILAIGLALFFNMENSIPDPKAINVDREVSSILGN